MSATPQRGDSEIEFLPDCGTWSDAPRRGDWLRAVSIGLLAAFGIALFGVAVLMAAGLMGCAEPVVIDPTPVGPVTPPPVPVEPPPVVATGAIDEAGYALIVEGMSEADVVARVGKPYRVDVEAGYRILTWVFRDSQSVAWAFTRGGVVERKSRR